VLTTRYVASAIRAQRLKPGRFVTCRFNDVR